MVSYSSILWALSFFGIGGWILYHTGVKVIVNHIGGLRFKKKVLNPNIKDLEIEIEAYESALSTSSLRTFGPFLQKFLYIKILSKDIVILRNMILREKNIAARNILLRTLALQLFEYYSDLENLYNHNFEKSFLKPLSPHLVSAFQGVKKINTLAKNLYYKKLKEIRLNVVGHRDFDSLKQREIIKRIDMKEILDISNMVLFVIYFLTICNVSLLKNIGKTSNTDVFTIPILKKYKWDFKQFEVYIDYLNKKTTQS